MRNGDINGLSNLIVIVKRFIVNDLNISDLNIVKYIKLHVDINFLLITLQTICGVVILDIQVSEFLRIKCIFILIDL